MKKTFIFIILFQSSVAFAVGKSLTVMVRSYENKKQVVLTSQADIEGKKIDAKSFAFLISKLNELPKSIDTISKCPRSFILIQYYDGKKSSSIFSCNDHRTEIRRKYISFSRRVI